MMKRKLEKKRLVICLAVLAVTVGVFCSCSPKQPSEPTRENPTIITEQSDLAIRVGEEIKLKKASSTDNVDGELTVKLNVLNSDENVYVVGGADQGVDAKNDIAFTPSKAGNYVVKYFVKNSAEKTSEKLIKLKAFNNGMNAIENAENWLTNNGGKDENGYITIGKKQDGQVYQENPTATYKQEKIRNNDVVTFIFNSSAVDGATQAWYMFFSLTNGYAEDAPTIATGVKNVFALEMLTNKIQIKTYDKVNEAIHKLLDGEDHMISAKVNVTPTKTVFSLWIDTSSSSQATMSVVLHKAQLDSAGTVYDPNLFSPENFGGYFNIMGKRVNSLEDEFKIKALTINDKAPIDQPIIEVKGMENFYFMNREISFPIASVEDATFGGQVENVKLYLKKGNGAFAEIEQTHTFTESGMYQLKYLAKDRNGNIAFKVISFSVADKETTANPTITLEGYASGDTITLNAMTEFTPPIVTGCKDSNDVDLEYSISIKGPANFDNVNSNEVIKIFAAGDYILSYTATDLTGKTTTVTIALDVVAAANTSGNLITNSPEDFVLSGSASIADNKIDMTNSSFTYTGQMIYGEKVSMLLDWSVASSDNMQQGAWDGTFVYIINMRGGINQTMVPTSSGEWPKGLSIIIDPKDHLTIQKEGHSSGIIGRLTFTDGIREFMHRKDLLLQFQIVDVLRDDGSVDYYRIMLWLNGVRVGSQELPWTYTLASDEDGNFAIKSRVANSMPSVTKAGWLQATAFVNDQVNGTLDFVKWLSIDGSYDKTELEVGTVDNEIFVTETYTVPDVKLKINGEYKTLIKKMYYNNTYELLDTNEIEITQDFIEGFYIEYIYNGIVYYRVDVTVHESVSDPVWDKALTSIVTRTGATYALPVLTSVHLADQPVTSGFVYTIKYKSGYTVKDLTKEQMQNFAPVLPADFTVMAYVNNQYIGSYEVANSSGMTGDLKDEPFNDGTKFQMFFTKELLWENTVTMNFTITGDFDILFMPIRGSLNRLDASEHANWVNGVAFRFYGDRISVVYNLDQEVNAYNMPKGFTGKGNHMLAYQVVNNKNSNGEIISISIKLWADGKLLKTVGGGDTVTIAMSTIAQHGGLEPSPLYGKQAPYSSYLTINSMYIDDADGTNVTPFYTADVDLNKEVTLIVNEEITLPTVSKILGMSILTATITLNGVEITSPYTFTDIGEYDLVYHYSDDTIYTLKVKVAQRSTTQFEFTEDAANNETVTRNINSPINIDFNLTANGVDAKADVIVKVIYNEYVETLTYAEYLTYKNYIRQNFVVQFIYQEAVLGERNVTVSNVSTGNIVTPSANLEGGGENNDGKWTGTKSPAYIAEYLHNYTVSVKLRIENIQYIGFSIRGSHELNGTYGYDWPQNFHFSFDDSLRLYFKFGSKDLASTSISNVWNESLKGTDVILKLSVQDKYVDGKFVGTAVKFYMNGTLLQLDDAGWHENNTLNDGNTLFMASDRGGIDMAKWNEPCFFGLFRTQQPWSEIKDVRLDGTEPQ